MQHLMAPNTTNFLQFILQGMRQYSYALNTKSRHYKDLSMLAKEPAFLNATTVYPVQTPEDFYRLHAYYSKVRVGGRDKHLPVDLSSAAKGLTYCC